MGLDVSHDCWHGSYLLFEAFRRRLQTALGLDYYLRFGGELPPIGVLRAEPLQTLLLHADNEGSIALADTEPLAARLEELAPLLAELPELPGDPDAYREVMRLHAQGIGPLDWPEMPGSNRRGMPRRLPCRGCVWRGAREDVTFGDWRAKGDPAIVDQHLPHPVDVDFARLGRLVLWQGQERLWPNRARAFSRITSAWSISAPRTVLTASSSGSCARTTRRTAAREDCGLRPREGVRILPGCGIFSYGGVYYDPRADYDGGIDSAMTPHPYSLHTWLEAHPELRAVDAQGRPYVTGPYSDIACPSQPDNLAWFKEALAWLLQEFGVGGVQVEVGDYAVCHCAACTARRGASRNPVFCVEDMLPAYTAAIETARRVDAGAWVVCESYSSFASRWRKKRLFGNWRWITPRRTCWLRCPRARSSSGWWIGR